MKSILEILDQAVELNQKLEKCMGESINLDRYVLLADTPLKPLTIVLGKMGLTAVNGKPNSPKYLHSKLLKFLTKELEGQTMWMECFNLETRFKTHSGMRDLESEYLNTTILRKLNKFDFRVHRGNREFLTKHTYNDRFTLFLVKHGFAKKFHDVNDNFNLKNGVDYKLLQYVENELLKDARFKAAFFY